MYDITISKKCIIIFNSGKRETEERIPNAVELISHTIKINS